MTSTRCPLYVKKMLSHAFWVKFDQKVYLFRTHIEVDFLTAQLETYILGPNLNPNLPYGDLLEFKFLQMKKKSR